MKFLISFLSVIVLPVILLSACTGIIPTGESEWAKASYAYHTVDYAETVTVETVPPGANVYLDDELVGQSPVEIKLSMDALPVYWKFKAGTGHFDPLQVDKSTAAFKQHLLGVTAPGYFQARETLTLEGSPALRETLGGWLPDPEPGSGQARTELPASMAGARSLEIVLLPQTQAAQPSASDGRGTLNITHPDPLAEIYVDGRFVGNAPLSIALAEGAHTIEVKQGEDSIYSRKVSVYADSNAALNISD